MSKMSVSNDGTLTTTSAAGASSVRNSDSRLATTEKFR